MTTEKVDAHADPYRGISVDGSRNHNLQVDATTRIGVPRTGPRPLGGASSDIARYSTGLSNSGSALTGPVHRASLLIPMASRERSAHRQPVRQSRDNYTIEPASKHCRAASTMLGSLKENLILSGFSSIAAVCSVAALRSLSFVLLGTRVSMACFKSPLSRSSGFSSCQ